MTNEVPQGPSEWDALHPYASLTPDAVLDALADIAPTPAQLQQLLVDNPERLYRFSEFEASHKGQTP